MSQLHYTSSQQRRDPLAVFERVHGPDGSMARALRDIPPSRMVSDLVSDRLRVGQRTVARGVQDAVRTNFAPLSDRGLGLQAPAGLGLGRDAMGDSLAIDQRQLRSEVAAATRRSGELVGQAQTTLSRGDALPGSIRSELESTRRTLQSLWPAVATIGQTGRSVRSAQRAVTQALDTDCVVRGTQALLQRSAAARRRLLDALSLSGGYSRRTGHFELQELRSVQQEMRTAPLAGDCSSALRTALQWELRLVREAVQTAEQAARWSATATQQAGRVGGIMMRPGLLNGDAPYGAVAGPSWSRSGGPWGLQQVPRDLAALSDLAFWRQTGLLRRAGSGGSVYGASAGAHVATSPLPWPSPSLSPMVVAPASTAAASSAAAASAVSAVAAPHVSVAGTLVPAASPLSAIPTASLDTEALEAGLDQVSDDPALAAVIRLMLLRLAATADRPRGLVQAAVERGEALLDEGREVAFGLAEQAARLAWEHPLWVVRAHRHVARRLTAQEFDTLENYYLGVAFAAGAGLVAFGVMVVTGAAPVVYLTLPTPLSGAVFFTYRHMDRLCWDHDLDRYARKPKPRNR